jgi:hypothetical protein
MKNNNVLQNRYGDIEVGSNVKFLVENQDDWGGDNRGTLIFENEEFKIQTKNSGILTIGKGYDVYWNTIEKIVNN